MNTETPRVFIAATRQNDGKTTTSLGLLAALQKIFPRIGYIKPVGQRFVEIEEQKIDEDTVLMDRVYRLNCPLVDMSPIAVEPDFTRKYLQQSNNDALVRKIQKAFDRVAWEKDFVLCEGSGHAGVGSVFDLSNAQVAALLNAKVIIVTGRSEEHTSELQSPCNLVCRLLLEKKNAAGRQVGHGAAADSPTKVTNPVQPRRASSPQCAEGPVRRRRGPQC